MEALGEADQVNPYSMQRSEVKQSQAVKAKGWKMKK